MVVLPCFEIKDEDLLARIGRLKTKSGVLETPYFFPVVNPLKHKQLVTTTELQNMGFTGIITNAYLLFRHGLTHDDVHRVLSFQGVIMTDSGAYQLMQYGDIEIDNRSIVKIQCDIGSDIGVILDIPTKYEDPRDKVVYSVEETLRRACEAIDIVENCKSTLWVLPIQGGMHLDLLRTASQRATQIPGYTVYGLGSPTTLLENFMFEKIIEMIATVRGIVESSKPLHLFGAGHPLIIPFAVALGVDLMDSASYIIYARDGRYITRRGTYRLEDLDYFPCSCPICSKYTPKDLMEMSYEDRVKLLAMHNLYTILEELRNVKTAIREGRLFEYLVERAHSHPAAMRAFKTLIKYLNLVIRRAPYINPRAKAVYLFHYESLYNPRILIPRINIENNLDPISQNLLILIGCIKEKPFIESRCVESIVEKFCNTVFCDVYIAVPWLGTIPLEASYQYPFSQNEIVVESISNDIVEDLMYLVLDLVLKYVDKYRDNVKIKIVCVEEYSWIRDFCLRLRGVVEELNITKNIVFYRVSRDLHMHNATPPFSR